MIIKQFLCKNNIYLHLDWDKIFSYRIF